MSPDLPPAGVEALRTAVRRAVAAGDRTDARRLRAELRAAERARDAAAPPPEHVPRVPLRERVHRVLALIGVPAAPKLVGAVHHAFLDGPGLSVPRPADLRRAEERAFRSAPDARPYYVCAALTADALTPARGLLALSTWPPETRMIGPRSARTDFLTAAVRVAEHAARLGPDRAERLLRRFAANIPGAAAGGVGTVDAAALAEAARAELAVHAAADARDRARAARRAAARLDAAGLLFGARPAPDRTHGVAR
ncbi:hypothetical protein [Actinomadura atramentaria]|uniref:hypothetical protein n=1 Tax=Actinomadura atramentaria TaxID=1990 RepID=UPI000363ECFC|nr:hypothetical protein [Actinomadura atramentaria]